MRPGPALLGVAVIFLVSLFLLVQTATTDQPSEEHEDEATLLWDEAMHGRGDVPDVGSCAAAGAKSSTTKRKLTPEVVTKALQKLATRLPLERAPRPPPVKGPLLKGPSVVRTPEERKKKVEELKELRGSLLEDRELRHAVTYRDRMRSSGLQQCKA